MLRRLRFIPDDSIVERTRWYINFRWLYIIMLSLPTVVAIYLSEGMSEPLKVLIVASAFAYFTNGVFYIVARRFVRPGFFQILAIALVVTDILIIDSIIIMLGGVESRSAILFVVPIIMSAATLGRKGIFATAGLALVSYNFIFFMYYIKFLQPNKGLISMLSNPELPQLIYIVTFSTTALLSILMAMDYILRLLRQKEREALKTVDDLKRAQEVGKFGSWEADLTTGKYSWSDEVYRLLGLDPITDDLTIEDFLSMVHIKDRRTLKAILSRAKNRPGHFTMDYRIFDVDGRRHYFHVEGESVADRLGGTVSLIGTIRDVSEEKALEQSKNEFVSLASHQLRTPATVIKQYLSMMLDGYAGELTEMQRTFLETAAGANDRQITIVNSLLGVAQLESGSIHLTFSEINLVTLLESLVKEYQPRAEDKSLTIKFTSKYKQLYCKGDDYHLQTAVENILDNAIRYTLPGKLITVRLFKRSKHVVVSVIDQGVGIDRKDTEKLFKKFSRIENLSTFQEEGAGLGLYWAEKIVSLHRGRIEVESTLGRGTTFSIVLPVASVKKSPPRSIETSRVRRKARVVTH